MHASTYGAHGGGSGFGSGGGDSAAAAGMWGGGGNTREINRPPSKHKLLDFVGDDMRHRRPVDPSVNGLELLWTFFAQQAKGALYQKKIKSMTEWMTSMIKAQKEAVVAGKIVIALQISKYIELMVQINNSYGWAACEKYWFDLQTEVDRERHSMEDDDPWWPWPRTSLSLLRGGQPRQLGPLPPPPRRLHRHPAHRVTRPRRRRARNIVKSTVGMVPTIPLVAITSMVPVPVPPPFRGTPLPLPALAMVVDDSSDRAAQLDCNGAPSHSSVNFGLLPRFPPSPSIPVAVRAVQPDRQPSVVPSPPLPSSRLYSDTKACLPHWRSAIAEWVAADPSKSRHCDRLLDHITHGLPIVPDPLPTDRHYPNTPLINQQADAVRKQLQQHLAMGAVELCERRDIAAVHPLHCVVKPDKLRDCC